MTKPTEEQEALMRKYKLIPDKWIVFSETSKKLVILSKRTKMRKVLEKERSKDG